MWRSGISQAPGAAPRGTPRTFFRRRLTAARKNEGTAAAPEMIGAGAVPGAAPGRVSSECEAEDDLFADGGRAVQLYDRVIDAPERDFFPCTVEGEFFHIRRCADEADIRMIQNIDRKVLDHKQFPFICKDAVADECLLIGIFHAHFKGGTVQEVKDLFQPLTAGGTQDLEKFHIGMPTGNRDPAAQFVGEECHCGCKSYGPEAWY